MFIRPATPKDIKDVPQLIENAFESHGEALLVSELREAGAIEYELVATINYKLVGHVVLSKLDAPEGCLALAPLSVDPDHQREGVGAALIQKALEAAEEDEWTAVFVVGNPNYYGKFGFDVDDADGFDTPYPAEFTAVKIFDQAAFNTLDPELIYPHAFSGLD